MMRDNKIASFSFKKNIQLQFTKYSGLSSEALVSYKLIKGSGVVTKYRNLDFFIVEFNNGSTSIIELDQVSSINLDIAEEK